MLLLIILIFIIVSNIKKIGDYICINIELILYVLGVFKFNVL